MTKNIIAIVVLVVLVVVVFFLFSENSSDVEEKKIVAKVISPIDTNRVDKLEIVRHDGSGTTLREEYIVLKKIDDKWRMTKPVDYKVIPSSIDKMLDVLGNIEVIDIISENPKRHHALQVGSELGIEVTASAGDIQLAHLIVGVSRKDMTFVRIPGADTVYRTHGFYRSAFNNKAKNLRDHAITNLDKGSVVRAKFINKYGELEIVRKEVDGEVKCEPVGIELQNFDWRTANVNLNALTSLVTRDYIDEPLSDDITGLGEGAARIEFEAADKGKLGTYTIWIGNEDIKKHQTYVKTSLSEQIFLVAAHILKRFDKKAEDYARTDEQVKQQAEQRKSAKEHADMHSHKSDTSKQQKAMGVSGQGAKVSPGSTGDQQIPPEVMKQLRQQMKEQKLSNPPASQRNAHQDH